MYLVLVALFVALTIFVKAAVILQFPQVKKQIVQLVLCIVL